MIKPPLLKLCSVIALAATVPAYAGVVPSAGTSHSVQGIAARELARRNDQVARAQAAIAEGDKAFEAKDYETAVQKYKAAADILPESPVTHKLRAAAVERYCIASVKLAEQQIAEGNFAQAEATAKAVLDPAYNPQCGPARTLLAHLKEPGYYNRTITPAFHAKVETVKALLVEGEGYYQSGQFDAAEKSYQRILNIDKYNTAAIEGLIRVERAQSEFANNARTETRSYRLKELDKAWGRPVPQFGRQSKIIPTGPQGGIGTAAIQNKLNRIIIPKVEFKDATVREAIDFLKRKSQELDVSETDPSRRGVNIVLQLNDPTGGTGAAPAAPADPAAPAIPGLEAGAGGAAAATPAPAAAAGSNLITLSLSNVPMAEVLRYITAAAGLKIKIDPYAVSVVPITAMVETLITKEYKIPPGTFTKSTGGGAGAAALPAAPTAGGGAGMVSGGMAGRVAAKDYFAGEGVQFPPGSSATFIPNGSRLIVRNTQEQLDLIDTLVEALNGQAPSQVDIEAKFVEITQTNLKELSFDWTLGQFNIPGSNKVFGGGGNGIASSNNFTFVDPSGNVVGGNNVTQGNRAGTTAISTNAIDALLFPTAANSTSSGILSAAGVFTDPQFQVVLRALNQKKGVDLLSSPRVTCKSGQEAEISIVREFKYPTEYNPPQVPSTSGSGNSSVIAVTPTTPTAFDVKQTGVLLHVQPTVGADGSTIDLQLEPQVVEFEGFVNYGSPIYGMGIRSNILTGGIESDTVLLTPNVINQPIFSTRKVRTSVSVWDGQTVMLGGLMREDVQKVEDKVPFLGDVPLLGRFFRSSVDQHSKRNLVIFVTARLINPAGDPLNTNDEEQAPDVAPVPAGAADTTTLLPPAAALPAR